MCEKLTNKLPNIVSGLKIMCSYFFQVDRAHATRVLPLADTVH